MSKSDLRLRFWGVCQYLYHLVTEPGWFTGESSERRMRREIWTRTIKGGHLAPNCFYGLADAAPNLGHPSFGKFENQVIVEARAMLGSYIRDGARRSGLLGGYLEAQLTHLEACEPCRSFVCETVRSEIDDKAKIVPFLRAALGGHRANGANGKAS